MFTNGLFTIDVKRVKLRFDRAAPTGDDAAAFSHLVGTVLVQKFERRGRIVRYQRSCGCWKDEVQEENPSKTKWMVISVFSLPSNMLHQDDLVS